MTDSSDKVSDAGLRTLAGLRERLKYLDVSNTQVTKSGITSLREELPNAKVVW